MDTVVFTNGCFDILHPGHIDLLERARSLGTRLIVGINSDRSVRSIKGPDRPLFSQDERKLMLLALSSVDEVIIFDEHTPEKLIATIRPNILVKGGDWATNEIVGSEFVTNNGGQVVSLPLKQGFSSTNIIERISQPKTASILNGDSKLENSIREHISTFEELRDHHLGAIADCFEMILKTVRNGNKLLICGNGGSAADAQHLAAEFVGRYETERVALPAISLTTDTSALTAISNDYGFERTFARQVEALASSGDCLIALSTSGTSPNVIAAVMEARSRGCSVIGMTGQDGKKLAALSDACVMVPSSRTARIQEAHITIAHIWCEEIDRAFADDSEAGSE